MRFKLRGVNRASILFLLALPVRAEVVDRILAVVDRQVITLSEAELAREIGTLRGGGELSLESAVDRLIESLLVEQEVKRFAAEPVPSEQVVQAIDSIRGTFPTEDAFQQALEARGVTDEILEQLVRRQVAISRYLEARFRPLVHVSDEEVERYFEEELLPVLRARGQESPLEESIAEGVRRILSEREFNERVDEWIEGLKSKVRIRRYVW